MSIQSAAPARNSAPGASTGARQAKATLHQRARGLSLVVAGGMLDGVSMAVRRLPIRTRYAASDGILWALWPALGRARRAAEANFRRVVGPEAASTVAARSVRNYGRMAMDFLSSRTMSPDEILRLVEVRGEERFHAAMAHGHGVIFALPHAGSWDVAAVFAQAYGCNLTIVTESDWATELVAGSRRSHGVTLAPRDQSLRALFRALRRQECVVMLSDITPPGVQTAAVPFFGAPARFPLGPARLSVATGAPVLVIMSVRVAENRYVVEAQPALMPPPTPRKGESADEAILAMTAEIAAGFERIIRAYPEQWYPFHPVWEQPSAPAR